MVADNSGERLLLNVNPKYYRLKHSLSTRARSCRIYTMNCRSGKMDLLYKGKDCTALALSPSGEYIASLSNSVLFIYNIATNTVVKQTHVRALTTLVFHPTDPYIATGDSEGQIVLWYQFADPTKVVTSTLHWHAHAVEALAFSEDGAYLLSGGEEAVLVVWQLDTGHKQFMPRLGASIAHICISPDGNTYALASADNAIRLLSAVTSKVERTVQGLQHAHTMPEPKTIRGLSTGIIAEPRGRGVIAMGGVPGTIQMYDPFNDRHVHELDVTGRNHISRTDDERIAFMRVEQLAYNSNGTWMATIERRVDGETTNRTILKLWSLDSNGQGRYTVNTRVDGPHGSGKISALAFHPRAPMLVTAASDRTFKLWVEAPRPYAPTMKTATEAPPSTYWVCQSVGVYRDYKVRGAAFSGDGSLLAVVYGQVITLWEPTTLTLRHTLLHPTPDQHVR
jgi:NET1-associated nuclear protein 1 (U3 small nucleolar RNA-associated protein 17)